MKLIAGVDIGNSTTEVCIGRLKDNKKIEFLCSALTHTTGTKGTTANIKGIVTALEEALGKVNLKLSQLDVIRLNEAAPVIGDTAMETITETIITESSMIGHNPKTPGGVGIGIGEIISIANLDKFEKDKNYIVVIPEAVGYEEAVPIINKFLDYGADIRGAIVQADEGVLISNRIKKMMPIVDEVMYIDKIPFGMKGVIEVAPMGQSIKTLSNPYGIASMLNLTPGETKYVVPIARSLIGTRSGVVIKTPEGKVKERVIPAGKLSISCKNSTETISIDSGADKIMQLINDRGYVEDVEGESGTNIGGMINNVKYSMASLTGQDFSNIRIKDLLAVDTMIPLKVQGGIAGETFMEKAVAIAAMVKTDKFPMAKIAEELQKKTGVFVEIAGVEAVMASLGAMTTPGSELPLAILDLGGGSTDAAIIDKKGTIKSVHLAGAGELVTMLINSELGLNNRIVAEEIKKYPLAKVENLYQIRIENGDIKFFDTPLNTNLYGRVVVLNDREMIPILKDIPMEKIVNVRRNAKEKVFVGNAIRALKVIAAMNDIRNIPNAALVGGSALDFEIPDMILSSFIKYRIVCGRGNIRRTEGPRNAVATGLVMSYGQGLG